MYLINIDDNLYPLPNGINIKKYEKLFTDGILYFDYLDEESKYYFLSELYKNISIIFCSFDINQTDFERKMTIKNNINYAHYMSKYFFVNNMYTEANNILKEIIKEMISYYANYKEYDILDISLRGR